MLFWERKAFRNGASLIIGVDEAGRGPIAGPVVAAAVLLRPSPLIKRFNLPRYRYRLDDSKKMSAPEREKSFSEIRKRSLFGIGLKDHNFIDAKNIRNATMEAMREAVEKLIKKYCSLNNTREKKLRKKICILIDGNLKPHLPYNIISIIKGDSRSFSIAAASIVAKITRDKILRSYDKEYPEYGFLKHKGYGTKLHFETIKKYGPCAIHRKSFAPIRER
jgi:ribonuclease HII